MVEIDADTELCVQSIGNPHDPAILFIGAATWSMDWWEEALCRGLASNGRRVVRYDTRDTGRSTSYPPGRPGYSTMDLVTDAVAILDALRIDRAHVVGLSMGGGIAQRLALKHRDRVDTLTLMSTSPIDPDIADLPGPEPQVKATFEDPSPEPDWSDRAKVVDYVVEGERPYAGPGSFDEPRLRRLAGEVFDRSRDMAAAMTNHFLLETDLPDSQRLGDLAGVPTLVLHGSADPMFSLAHGKALADAVPGARLVELDGVGHQLPPVSCWDFVIRELVDHTEPAS